MGIFFVETDYLDPQTDDQAFGPILSAETTSFRLGSLHTVSADSKAFAVTSGQLIAQSIDAALVTLVLKPYSQIKGLPPIQYFVYRGIRRSSLIDSASDNIASRTNNDLTRSIWDSADAISSSVAEVTGQAANIEPGESILGLGTLPAMVELVNQLFEQSDATYPTVKAGWHIGDFATGTIGFEVVLDHLGTPLTLADVQQVDPILEVPENALTANDAAAFARRHAMDRVLHSIDPVAFFGAYGRAIRVFRNGAAEYLGDQGGYDEILSKYVSKHRVYLYLFDEFNRSFDLDESYPSSVTLALGSGVTGQSVPTRSHGWPIFYVEQSVLDPALMSGEMIPLSLSLPTSSNSSPLLFVSTGLQQPSTAGRDRDARFIRLIPDAGGVSLPIKIELATVVTADGSRGMRAGFIYAKYGRGYDFSVTLQAGTGGKLRRNCLFDALFQPFGMGAGACVQTLIRICHGQVLVDDPTRMNGAVAMSTGLAVDSERVAFIAYPSAKEVQSNLGSPLSMLEERTSGSRNFFEELEKRVGMMLVRRDADIAGTNLAYIVPESLGDGPKANLFEFDVTDLQMIVISRSEFDSLEKLVQTSTLDHDLPIYLGIDVERGPTPEIEAIHLSIRGYDTSSGSPQLADVDTNITILSPTVII
ncbi:MAG: hypothetical protein K8S27_03785 [Candidatus Omnitrophica bacterium]|nr:hypothetical protein [Candidatus Omnitrophota bacterium]